MGTTLFTCFGTVVGLIGALLVFVFVIIPIIGHIFAIFGRLIRFVFQESRDITLLPIALFVCAIKLLRATICIILARWDVANREFEAAKKRGIESWERLVAILIENPLRIIALETKLAPSANKKYTAVHANLKTFDGYTVVGTLPSGGSGAKLFVANSSQGFGQVVIKSFDITSGSMLPQIVRESRAMESAKKLGLVIDHHLDEHRFWYAMPYHAGEHLGFITQQIHDNSDPLSESQLRTLLTYQYALLQTLATYHEAGLWHKDVKPDNIIIHNGTAKLVDLGLVTPLGSAMTLTTHGTEYFRDPELVRQANRGVKVHQIDGSKFDVYGAGAVLYFMLENTFPAQGGLSSFSKQSPECMRWVVRRAMADYDKRYSSIQEMLADIHAILQSKSIGCMKPADLPSMSGVTSGEPTVGRPSYTTQPVPNMGSGNRTIKTQKTNPIGFFALIIAIVVGVVVVLNTTKPQDEYKLQNDTTLVLDYPQPTGRILVVDELGASQSDEIRRVASNTLTQLGVSGWDIFSDPETEAIVRRWLPTEISTAKDLTRLTQQNLGGILVLQQDKEGQLKITFLSEEGNVKLGVVQYVDG